jgi:hypothetical protein
MAGWGGQGDISNDLYAGVPCRPPFRIAKLMKIAARAGAVDD